jgi:uncharacterized protein (DUF983 family)
MLSAAMQGSPFSDLRQQTVPPALMSGRVMPNISGPILWRPNQQQKPGWVIPGMATAILRGAGPALPSCSQTRLFGGYLTAVQSCAVCGATLGLYPSDDAPPYIAILLVLHRNRSSFPWTGALFLVRLALLDANGPTGTFSDEDGPVES